eukprot:c17338_g1_i2.p1 GENE.c17338_g1_i2~~c17338_g1_i2.p1  ORF type:complete len:460 (+),score=143.38 c17338_g1_i2:76-1455(+)
MRISKKKREKTQTKKPSFFSSLPRTSSIPHQSPTPRRVVPGTIRKATSNPNLTTNHSQKIENEHSLDQQQNKKDYRNSNNNSSRDTQHITTASHQPAFLSFKSWFSTQLPENSSNILDTIKEKPKQEQHKLSIREEKLRKALSTPIIDLKTVTELSWFGVPDDLRPTIWKLLLAYIPPTIERQASTLLAKRTEYRQYIPEYFDIPDSERTSYQMATLKQIKVDAPRTVPSLQLFRGERAQQSLIRVLYIWAIRHPASGYVQGMNDLVVPYFVVFLSEIIDLNKNGEELRLLEAVSDEVFTDIEADVYWCLSRMLQGIQDNYTSSQPGIQRMVFKLQEILTRVDEPLCKHMKAQSIEFLVVGPQWMICLLVRELPFSLLTRLWDLYLSEQQIFIHFHVYVCAALLKSMSPKLQKLDLQELMPALRNFPVSWSMKEFDELIAQAYVWWQLFEASPSHLTRN